MPGRFQDLTFVVVDTETTGFSPRFSSLIEVGLSVHKNGREIDRFSSLIGPPQEVPWRIERITGIRARDLQYAPLFADVADNVDDRIAAADFVVAHNVPFDRAFVDAAFAGCGRALAPRRWIDSAVLARRALGFGKLSRVAAHYGVPHERAHQALDDARVTAQVLYRVAAALRLTTFDELCTMEPAAITVTPEPATQAPTPKTPPAEKTTTTKQAASAPKSVSMPVPAAKRLAFFR